MIIQLFFVCSVSTLVLYVFCFVLSLLQPYEVVLSHFTDEETEVHRYYVACPRPQQKCQTQA